MRAAAQTGPKAEALKKNLTKIKLPPGFKAEVFVSNILDARSMREGDKGTIFVSSLFAAGKLYAVVNNGGQREVKTLAEKLFLPSGIEYHQGSLYLATPKDIVAKLNAELVKALNSPDVRDRILADGSEVIARVRLEGDHDAGPTGLGRQGGESRQHVMMPAMHSIEGADSDNRIGKLRYRINVVVYCHT